MEDKRPVERMKASGFEDLMVEATQLRNVSERGFTATVNISQARLQILNAILMVALASGLVTYFMILPIAIEQQLWWKLGVYTAAVIAVFIITIFRRIPNSIRAVILIFLVYSVGLSTLLANGLSGSGRLFLMAMPILAALLFKFRYSMVTLAISVGTVIVMGGLLDLGKIQIIERVVGTSDHNTLAWVWSTINFTLLTSTLTIASSYFLLRLEKNLHKQRALVEDLERGRRTLENRIIARTHDLDRRLLQIRTAADISRSISTQMDIVELLPEICELIKERFNLYYVGIFLIEDRGKTTQSLKNSEEQIEEVYAVLAAGTDQAGKEMLAAGHKLSVGGDSMIGWATGHRQARIALDVGVEAVRFDNPNLPKTRSELALPMLIQDEALGAITIQSDQPEAFDENDIVVLQGIADSLGSAIVNARLFKRVQENLNEIETLHRHYLQSAWSGMVERQGEISHTYYSPNYSGDDDNLRSIEIPLVLRNQEIGNLILEADITPGLSYTSWEPEELAMIQSIADQTTLALENARLLQEAQRLASREAQINWIATQVRSSINIEAVLQNTIQELGKTLGASRTFIQIGSEEDFTQAGNENSYAVNRDNGYPSDRLQQKTETEDQELTPFILETETSQETGVAPSETSEFSRPGSDTPHQDPAPGDPTQTTRTNQDDNTESPRDSGIIINLTGSISPGDNGHHKPILDNDPGDEEA